MAILYDETQKLITIHTKHTTYQMKVDPFGYLLHTYYGPAARGDMSYALVYRDRGFSCNPGAAGNDRSYSLDTLPLEYSWVGSGDMRATPLSVRRSSGVSGCDLHLCGCEIRPGKYSLPGLPAVYGSEEEAETLILTMKDDLVGITVELQYGVLPELDVITRAARISNHSGETLTLQNAAGFMLDLLSGEWELLHFHGRHTAERHKSVAELGQREVVVGSRRGTSSHQQNPFLILKERDTGEQQGQCCGISLLYSGSWAANASVDQYGTTRLVMGIQPELFDYELAPGEVFQTPEAAMTYSDRGLAHLSHTFHKLITHHICRGPWKTARRPVLINNWEATEMNFTGDRIVSIAKQAAELGVEMMVLDDGWFGARRDDNAGLGDWVVNEPKLGCTMGEMAQRIRDMGMKFGLWIEPEMVNEDSDLFRTHPDWAFVVPGKEPVRGRNQLLLDFSRPEVADAIFDQIAAVLDECRADYVKMDMNRCIVDVYNATLSMQSRGKVLHQYVLGVYRFMEKLLERYPELLLEGCSGGGGRFDAGMLYYCPQIWCSDDTEAIERLQIQYGTSFGYPVRTMGAHVSAVPNGLNGRAVPFHTRGVVAMSGTFGYELDLNLISEEEKRMVTAQIADFKKYWNVIQNGLYYRLTDVTENHLETAWMMVTEDGSEALVNVVALDSPGNAPNRFVRCMGLTPDALYREEKSGIIYPGAALMSQGLPLTREQRWQMHQYEAAQFYLLRV